MSSTTTASSIDQYRVWVQLEGREATRLIYEPETTIIDDLKKMVLTKNCGDYRSFFRQKYLNPDDLIPDGTSRLDPIIFRPITTHHCELFFFFVLTNYSLVYFYDNF